MSVLIHCPKCYLHLEPAPSEGGKPMLRCPGSKDVKDVFGAWCDYKRPAPVPTHTIKQGGFTLHHFEEDDR